MGDDKKMRGVTFTHGAWAVRALADACILTALAGHDVVSVVKRGIYFWLALPLLTVFVMFVLVFGALFIWAREDWRARRNM